MSDVSTVIFYFEKSSIFSSTTSCCFYLFTKLSINPEFVCVILVLFGFIFPFLVSEVLLLDSWQ